MESKRMLRVMLGLCFALLVVACGPTPQTTPAALTATPGQQPTAPVDSPLPTATEVQETRLTPTVTRLPAQVGSTPAPPAIGEVPTDLLAAIAQDLAGRLSADAGQIEVERAQFVVWNDGSLGCPEPGMMYTQALVEGYWVILRHGGQAYDYRATEDGFFRLCQNPELLPPSTPGDGDTE